MQDKHNILYVHGYNGSANSERSQYLKKYLPESCTVFAPSIPVICADALMLVKNTVVNQDIDMIVASSLGGFVTLAADLGIYKIVINPVLNPSLLLPAIGDPMSVAESYAEFEELLISEEEYNKTYGIFADKDSVVNCRDQFEKLYKHVIDMKGAHQALDENIRDVVTPLVLKLFNID